MKQYRQLTYEELAFHLEDSDAFRSFSRLEMGQYPCKSVLQENIKAIREETWETIHSEILDYARQEKIETGRVVRIDSNGSGDRHPSSHGFNRRVVKKTVMTILNARKDTIRINAYRDLLHYASLVIRV